MLVLKPADKEVPVGLSILINHVDLAGSMVLGLDVPRLAKQTTW